MKEQVAHAPEGWQALVVGGSGMLHGTCLQLAESGWDIGVVWRDTRRLEQLVQASRGLRGRIDPVACDYEDIERYSACLDRHVQAVRPIRLAITWIHGGAERALQATVDAVGRKPAPRRTLLEVHGHSDTVPAEAPLRLGPEWVRRHATLGFRIEQDGHLRWLTDREIAEGVADAVRSSDPEAVIGSTKPWSLKT